MVHVRPLPCAFLLVLGLVVLSETKAQLTTGNVHVYVTFPDDRSPQEQMKVELIGSGNEVARTFTNDHGQAQFMEVEIGNYRVRVSGQGIQPAESEMFGVDARKGTQTIFVRVRPNRAGAEQSSGNGAPTVAASDLKVPKNAKKELNKATQLIADQQWQKAVERLDQAIALYPQYAEAYTDLGVAYARLGDTDKEREAFHKAIEVDDHFAPALVNLAQMEMRLHNFPAAEGDLKKALSIKPIDVRTLVLLAQTELLNSEYEEVIATARRVHAMSHASFGRIHYVAARAFERLNRIPEAVTELKLFLKEEPSGPLTAAANQELAAIQNRAAIQSQSH